MRRGSGRGVSVIHPSADRFAPSRVAQVWLGWRRAWCCGARVLRAGIPGCTLRGSASAPRTDPLIITPTGHFGSSWPGGVTEPLAGSSGSSFSQNQLQSASCVLTFLLPSGVGSHLCTAGFLLRDADTWGWRGRTAGKPLDLICIYY